MRITPVYLKWVHTCTCMMLTVWIMAGSAFAQPEANQKVLAFGTSYAKGKNSEKAREQAIADGLRSAVAQAIVTMKPGQFFVDNFSQINTLLDSQAESYVLAYKVLGQASVGNRYRVLVETEIATDQLQQYLNSLQVNVSGSGKLPSVLLFISEQNVDEITAKFWWAKQNQRFQAMSEKGVAKALEEQQFSIIDHSKDLTTLGMEPAVLESMARPDIDVYEAVHIAKRLGADVVILGTASARPSMNTMADTIRSFVANVRLQAYWTQSSQQIAAVEQSAVAMDSDDQSGGDQALTTAGYLAGQDLAYQLSMAREKDETGPQTIEMVVGGTGNLGNFVMFRRTLSELPGVERFQIKEMKPNEATILVTYKGSARKLADTLVLKTFETFGVNLYDVSPGQLRIELVPK